jgi:hypothetical protein
MITQAAWSSFQAACRILACNNVQTSKQGREGGGRVPAVLRPLHDSFARSFSPGQDAQPSKRIKFGCSRKKEGLYLRDSLHPAGNLPQQDSETANGSLQLERSKSKRVRKRRIIQARDGESGAFDMGEGDECTIEMVRLRIWFR